MLNPTLIIASTSSPVGLRLILLINSLLESSTQSPPAGTKEMVSKKAAKLASLLVMPAVANYVIIRKNKV